MNLCEMCEGVSTSEPSERLCRYCETSSDILYTTIAQRNEARHAKDAAYSERDKLVALLSALYPAWLARHPDEDTSWDDDWRWIVFMHLPDGKGGDTQASWHIHDSELPMFSHLAKDHLYGDPVRGTPAPAWDGHSTEEKYQRLEFVRTRAAAERGCPLCGDYR